MAFKVALVFFVLSCQLTAPAQACVGWAALQKKIRATWAKDRAGYKILSIKRDGAVRRYTQKVRAGRRVVTAKFCSQATKVAAKRDNGTQATFGGTWHYQQKGARWIFHHHAMGTVEEKVATGEQPAKKKMKQLIAAAWVREVEKSDRVTKVLMTKPKKATGWKLFSTLVDVYITEKDGKKVVCKDYNAKVYKGKKVDGTSTQYGTGEGPWEATFDNQSKYRSRCKPQ